MAKTKPLSVFSLVMINIIAIDNIRSLPASAEFGLTLISYYFAMAILFFIPIALVSAELATALPKKGGVYAWVREAFGPRWGCYVIWLQWIYNVVWYPTQMAFIAAVISHFFPGNLSENPYFISGLSFLLFTVATIANNYGMRISSFVSTLGAIFGTLIPMMLITLCALLWVYQGHPVEFMQNNVSWLPSTGDKSHIGYLSLVIFGLVGIEMSAVHAEEVENPQKSYPKAIAISTLVIMSTLVISSLSIATILPPNELNIMTGVIQVFNRVIEVSLPSSLNWIHYVLNTLIIFGSLSAVSAWIIGPSKGLMVAANEGAAPNVLKKENRYGAPINILILQIIVFTCLCSTYHFLPIQTAFFMLTAFTDQLAMIGYIFLLAAAFFLRHQSPHLQPKYKVPGGIIGMAITCVLGFIGCIIGLAAGFMLPDNLQGISATTYVFIILFGIVIISLPPILFKHRKQEPL
ncbi:MAG TPA: amino acid permease [Gammaproteobacteria bacterium]|nr:amino acid permease [Gammaproteobacteria bacterium]